MKIDIYPNGEIVDINCGYDILMHILKVYTKGLISTELGYCLQIYSENDDEFSILSGYVVDSELEDIRSHFEDEFKTSDKFGFVHRYYNYAIEDDKLLLDRSEFQAFVDYVTIFLLLEMKDYLVSKRMLIEGD